MEEQFLYLLHLLPEDTCSVLACLRKHGKGLRCLGKGHRGGTPTDDLSLEHWY